MTEDNDRPKHQMKLSKLTFHFPSKMSLNWYVFLYKDVFLFFFGKYMHIVCFVILFISFTNATSILKSKLVSACELENTKISKNILKGVVCLFLNIYSITSFVSMSNFRKFHGKSIVLQVNPR